MDPSRPANFDGSPDRRRRESDEEDENESSVRVPNRDRSRRRQGTDRRRRESDEEDEDGNTVRVRNRNRSRRSQGTDRRRRESDEEDESTVRVPNRDRSRSPREQIQSQDDGSLEDWVRRMNQRIANWNQWMEDPTNQSAPGSPGQQPCDTPGTQPQPTYEFQEVEQYHQVGQQIAEMSDQCPVGTQQAGQAGVQSLTEFETVVQAVQVVQAEGPSNRSTPARSTRTRSTDFHQLYRAIFGSSSESLSNDPFGRHELNDPSSDDFETPPPRVDTPPPGSPNFPRYQSPRTPPPRYQTPPPRYALQSACATHTPPRSIAYSPLSFPASPPPTYTRFYQPPAWCQNPPGHFSASLSSTSFQPTDISDDNSEDQRSPQRELHCSPVLSRSRKRRREESGSE